MAGIAALLLCTLVAGGTPPTDDGAGARDVERDDLHTSAPPAYQLDARLLRAAFLDLLGRPPFADERERWSGRGLAELLDEVLGGEAYWDAWVREQLDYFLLIDNFRPETERVVALPSELADGRIDVRDALHRIVLSSSFDQRNPGADTFVTVVMEQLLGIVVQADPRELAIGKALYDGSPGTFLGKRGESQADVVRIAIEDERCTRLVLAREHERLLRATPDRRALVELARDLDRGSTTLPAIVRAWMLSPAWLERLERPRPQPNRMFVRSLHVDLLDRLPDEDEARRMRGALDGLSDPKPLRSVLARLLLDSGRAPLPEKSAITDPTRWIGRLFEHFLGRAATREELREFVRTFEEPDCRPWTVVYALVSCPEYHSY